MGDEMRTLDQAYDEAVNYLDSLGEERHPRLYVCFFRTNDGRRDVMRKNGTPLIYSDASISIKILPGDNVRSDEHHHQWNHFKSSFAANAAELGLAVDDVVSQVKAFLAPAVSANIDPFS